MRLFMLLRRAVSTAELYGVPRVTFGVAAETFCADFSILLVLLLVETADLGVLANFGVAENFGVPETQSPVALPCLVRGVFSTVPGVSLSAEFFGVANAISTIISGVLGSDEGKMLSRLIGVCS